MEGQAIETVLSLFGKKVSTARVKYRVFVEEGVAQGRRNDLVGGGLRRSQAWGGLSAAESGDKRESIGTLMNKQTTSLCYA